MSKPQNTIDEDMYVSGSIWKADWPFCRIATLQFLSDKYCLLGIGRGWNAPTVLSLITDPDKSGKWQYTFEELPDRLKNWRKLPDQYVRFVNGREVERSLDLIAIVREVASEERMEEDGMGNVTCVYCYENEGEHTASCLWVRAQKLLQEIDDAADNG